MRCPVNTVKTRMFHARRRLAKLLPLLEMEAEQGLTEDHVTNLVDQSPNNVGSRLSHTEGQSKAERVVDNSADGAPSNSRDKMGARELRRYGKRTRTNIGVATLVCE